MNNTELFARYGHGVIPAESSYFSEPGTLRQAERDVVEFLKKEITSIAIYGMGQGYHFDALRAWLDKSAHHQLVFIEDNLAVVKSFLEQDRARILLSHPQVSIALWGHGNQSSIYALLSTDFYFIALPSYQKKSEVLYPALLQEVYAVHAYISAIWHYQEQANFYFHLSHLDEYQISKGLEIKSPLVICGAGPSLEPYLDAKELNPYLVLASGTAMNILNAAGIIPDLGVAFDAKLSGSRRLQSSSAFTTPFFVDLDASHGVKYLQGPKILTLQKGCAAWKLHLLKCLGIEDCFLKIGPSITSTHYAMELGICLKVPEEILLGVDLSYKNGRRYAGKRTWLVDEDPLTPIADRKDLIEVETVNSEKVMTSRTFFQEASIYTQLAKQHPEIHFKHNLEGLKAEKKDLKEVIAKQPFFPIPLSQVKLELLKWKNTLLKSPDLLLKGYRERLELKFFQKRRYEQVMKIQGFNEIEPFCQKVLQLHLSAIDEAVSEIDEKMAFPDITKSTSEVPDLEGVVKLYYGNGQLKMECEYTQGQRNGIYRFYSRSGALLEEGHYRKGEPYGIYRQWNKKGFLEEEIVSHANGAFDLIKWNDKNEVVKEIKSGFLFSDEINASLDDLFKELS